MDTDEGKEIYRWRKITVEPIIGQIKDNFGFRQFCLRGLDGAKVEINIVAIVHNLKKIWRYRGEKGENYGEFENFNVYFVEVNLIAGRRPLLYEGERNAVKRKRSVPFSVVRSPTILFYLNHYLELLDS